jgi:hypothetical protein
MFCSDLSHQHSERLTKYIEGRLIATHRSMKFPLFSLLSILPFVAAQEDEQLNDISARLLADRMLSFDPIAGYEPLTKVTDQVSGLQKGIVETDTRRGAYSNGCVTSLECNRVRSGEDGTAPCRRAA